MDLSLRRETLRKLAESDFRRDLLIPLLFRMGFKSVTEYHGCSERGKDIICFDVDKLGERRYLAIVAKVCDLTGSASSNRGLSEIVCQVEQCFNEAYHDLWGMRTITMDQVWIVTTGRVVPGAADSVIGKLEKSNLSKLVRILHGDQLVTLIDNHYPSYWNQAGEPADLVRAERERLQIFVRKLLRELGADEADISNILSQLRNSDLLPTVEKLTASHWSVRYSSADSVVLEEASADYVRGLYSPKGKCGYLHEAFADAKETLEGELEEVEETMCCAAKALSTSDPWEFVNIYNSDFDGTYGFLEKLLLDTPKQVSRLVAGLKDIDEFRRRLEAKNCLEDVLRVVQRIEALETDVTAYLTGTDADEVTLFWILSIRPGEWSIRLAFDEHCQKDERFFTTKHRRSTSDHAARRSDALAAADVVRAAQRAFRKFVDSTVLAAATDETSSA